jgi:hypothetical protein
LIRGGFRLDHDLFLGLGVDAFARSLCFLANQLEFRETWQCEYSRALLAKVSNDNRAQILDDISDLLLGQSGLSAKVAKVSDLVRAFLGASLTTSFGATALAALAALAISNLLLYGACAESNSPETT